MVTASLAAPPTLVDWSLRDDFFRCLLDSLPSPDRDWVLTTLERYALVNGDPNGPKARL